MSTSSDLRLAIRNTIEDPPEDLNDPAFIDRCDRIYFTARILEEDWEFSEQARERDFQRREERLARD